MSLWRFVMAPVLKESQRRRAIAGSRKRRDCWCKEESTNRHTKDEYTR